MRYELLLVAAVIAGGGALLVAGKPSASGGMLGSYTTDLSARTPNQRFNAARAAKLLDGVVVKPGTTFSFDDAVGGWSADQGYRKAPVSYDGVLVDDYGGGVCETSTTLYNAALVAGLPIVERHPHTFAPSYAPPGRDAAVAYPTADLKFRNTGASPITIRVMESGDRLICRLLSPSAKRPPVTVSTTVLDRIQVADTPPSHDGARRAGVHRSKWTVRGRDGVRVAVYRTWHGAMDSGEQGKAGMAGARRELISEDTYLPISRSSW